MDDIGFVVIVIFVMLLVPYFHFLLHSNTFHYIFHSITHYISFVTF